jgi:hypothetical protein
VSENYKKTGPVVIKVGRDPSLTARVVRRRGSLPERLVNRVYKVVDLISTHRGDYGHGESTIHVGSTVESEPVRALFGILAKE